MHYSCCCWLFSKSNFVSFVCFGKLVKIDRYQLSKLWRRSKIAFLLKPSAAKIWDRFGGPTLLCRMSGAEQRRAAFWQMSRLLLLSKLLRRLSAIVSNIYEILNIIDSFLIFVPFFRFRLCSLTLTRLALHKPLGADLNSVIIAVKMQVRISYKLTRKPEKICALWHQHQVWRVASAS